MFLLNFKQMMSQRGERASDSLMFLNQVSIQWFSRSISLGWFEYLVKHVISRFMNQVLASISRTLDDAGLQVGSQTYDLVLRQPSRTGE